MMNHIVPFLGKEVEDQLDELGQQLMEIEREREREDDESLRISANNVRRRMSALLRGEDPETLKHVPWRRISFAEELKIHEESVRKRKEETALCTRMCGTHVVIIEYVDDTNVVETETEAEVMQVIDHQVLLRTTHSREFFLMSVHHFVERFEDNEIHINVFE